MLRNSCFTQGFIRVCATAVMCGGMAASHAQDGPSQNIIVMYRDQSPDTAERARTAQIMSDSTARLGIGLREVRQMTNGAHVMSIDGHLTRAEIRQLVANLSADPNVEFAEEDASVQVVRSNKARVVQRIADPPARNDAPVHAALVPNDPRYNEQWNYFDSRGGINLPAAWDLATGKGVFVADLGTGYRPHADLVQNIVGGYDFVTDLYRANDGDGRDSSALDPGDGYIGRQCPAIPSPPEERDTRASWQGTHSAGTIAAKTNNGVGVAGVAYDARLVPVRVMGRCGGSVADASDAIAWAAGAPVTGVPVNTSPVKVMNLSFGFGRDECPRIMQQAIDTARARGTTVVVDAGYILQNASGYSPGNCKGVIVVAGLSRSGIGYQTNFGDVVDIAAPVGDSSDAASEQDLVLSTYNEGAQAPGADSYQHREGFSAAPHVTGVVALMYSVKPSLTPDQVESILKRTARPFVRPCNQCGAGVVDAAAAVAAAKALP